MVREKENQALDMAQIFRTLRRKLWIIGLAAAITAVAGFVCGQFIVKPKYDANVTFYVNNSGEIGNSDLTSSDISASYQLIKTYGAIIKSRSVLEPVISLTQCPYTCEQLQKMIEVEAVDGSQIMEVTVTTGDPQQSVKIADSIAQVLPQRIAEIMKTTSVEMVDEAVTDFENRSPDKFLLSAIGLLLGGGVTALILVVVAALDDRIYSDTYLEKFTEHPILAKIASAEDTEAYRRLDAQLDYAVSASCPVIGIAGAVTGDDGATTAFHLACARAERGQKVLLVHCGDATLAEENVKTENCEHLQILAVDLLAEDNAGFLEKQKADYDYILLDLPAMNEFADTLLLAGQLDGLILSVRLGYSRKKDVDDCLGQLLPSGLKMIGYAVHNEK